MKKRNLIPKNEKIRREQDPIPWRYCLLTLVCGLLLVVGFFWAARQHFSAMDFGIKNAKLRQQKESLEAERRLLERNKEVSLSPGEIKKVAKKIGLQDLTAESIEVVSAVRDTISPQTPQKTYVAKTVKVEKTDNQKKPEATKENKEVKPKNSPAPVTDLRERITKKGN
jgi:hypothetical protein